MMPVYVAASHAARLAAEGVSMQTGTGAGTNADQGRMLQSSVCAFTAACPALPEMRGPGRVLGMHTILLSGRSVLESYDSHGRLWRR